MELYAHLSDAGSDDDTLRADGSSGLEDLVRARLKAYAVELRGHDPRDLYELIMPQLERPLIEVAMELSGGTQIRAASMLGIHRNTLRARLKSLGLDRTQAASENGRPP